MYGIVIKAGGRVLIASTPEQGTAAHVVPPQAGALDAPGDAVAANGSAPAEPALVLVVDDESAIRTSVSRYLRHRGYRTVEAANGEEALEQLEAMSWKADLILTDMVMPRMSGRELVRRVRASHPDMPVLCMSGHVQAPDEDAAEPWGRGHLVAKPFDLRDLAERVGQAVAR